jgi:hypothetical protein
VVLLLKKTLYGLKQAYRFWLFLLTFVRCLNFDRSKADPCLYYKWAKTGALILWFSLVDDCFMTGPTSEIVDNQTGNRGNVHCDDGGEVRELVG